MVLIRAEAAKTFEAKIKDKPRHFFFPVAGLTASVRGAVCAPAGKISRKTAVKTVMKCFMQKVFPLSRKERAVPVKIQDRSATQAG